MSQPFAMSCIGLVRLLPATKALHNHQAAFSANIHCRVTGAGPGEPFVTAAGIIGVMAVSSSQTCIAADHPAKFDTGILVSVVVVLFVKPWRGSDRAFVNGVGAVSRRCGEHSTRCTWTFGTSARLAGPG